MTQASRLLLLLVTQGSCSGSPLLASSASYSKWESVRAVLGVLCAWRGIIIAAHINWSDPVAGRSLTAWEAGSCSFPVYPGRGKGIGGLLTGLSHSCLRDIFDSTLSWLAPFAALVKAWTTEQRAITSVIPGVQSQLDKTPNFFSAILFTLVILPAEKKLFWHPDQCLAHSRYTRSIFEMCEFSQL